MTGLFSQRGRSALRALAHDRSILVFDLDGTLAPLVANPQDAQVLPHTAALLRALSSRWRVAVMTGRAAQDAIMRLGFTPHYLFGNHGAERWGSTNYGNRRCQLQHCRQQLRWNLRELRERQITVEDKGLSLALHYRQSANPANAREWLDAFIPALGVGIATFYGHCVLNITPADAPNKGTALLEVLQECGAKRALVIGDDENDEPAFAKAPAGSVSVRIGPEEFSTGAMFKLASQTQVDTLLSMLVQLRR